MMKSMTGYGTATVQTEAGRSYTVEIKSVNHRYCDVNVKLPGKLSFLEHDLKKLVKERFQRGRFDLYLALDEFGKEARNISFDHELAAYYVDELTKLSQALKLDARIDPLALIRMPEVMKVEPAEIDQEAARRSVHQVVGEALEQLEAMRVHEGKVLEDDIIGYLEEIRGILEGIPGRAESSLQHYKTALEERVKRLMDSAGEVDPERLAQEVVFYADKIDISEELTRLHGHIEHFLHLLQAEDAVGRKLDFLIQEMNREINTIGSKSNNAEISQQVMEVKAILEKIREQVQNIE